jgi:predicted RNase H-like nuclease
MMVVGADGLGPRWIATVLVDGQFAGTSAFSTFRELLASVPDALAVTVNVPLGLVAYGWRRCDALVRSFVGPACDGVVQVPPRAAVEESDHGRAAALCLKLTGTAATLPSDSLRARILEVDALIRETGQGGGPARSHGRQSIPPPGSRLEPRALRRGSSGGQRPDYRGDLRHLVRAIRRDSAARLGPSLRRAGLPAGRIVEGNAEASYRLLLGRPLEHPRPSREGIAQRIGLLAAAGIDIPADAGRVGGMAVERLLDAAVLSWTAKRYLHGHARSAPPQEQWQLDGGRIVAIWI